MIDDELDKELQDSAQQEVSALSKQLETVERDLLITLLPEEPADERNVILEVRAGAGGTEASFFAGELFQMYRQYAGTPLFEFSERESAAAIVRGLSLSPSRNYWLKV